MRYRGIAVAIVGLCAAATAPAIASDCETGLSPRTPSSEFTALEGGSVVRHETTGLEWKRCVEGRRWAGGTCKGNAKKFLWQEALQHAADQEKWRLPNINELRSIVERCSWEPAINRDVFPVPGLDYDDLQFFSSTPAHMSEGKGRVINFWRGQSESIERFDVGPDDPDDYRRPIRLVRTAD